VPHEISEYLVGLHTRHGVEIVLGAGVSAIARTRDAGLSLQLTNGSVLDVDIVVAGVGLEVNEQIARSAGLACGSGILVDSQCRTSDPDIFAAGDVAVAPNRWAGAPTRLESWQNAQDQGIAAARAALGEDVHYDPLPWFWSDQFDANVQIYGLPSPVHRAVVRGEIGAPSFLVFYVEGEQVKAAVGVNAARELRFVRRLIEQGRPVNDSVLRDRTVPLNKLQKEAPLETAVDSRPSQAPKNG
jgi:3-phenylpropionate/trans-cinnamate dioxygenase ferredoxin reductase subunit